jgi:DnaJ-class molecular chaperone
MASALNPYETLGVGPDASDAQIRTAYRRLVQLHHPDHNAGSAESARRFEEVQEAYARIRELRKGGSRRTTGSEGPRAGTRAGASGAGADPAVDARLEDLERQLREAQVAREQARRAARDAAAASTGYKRPSDEELGYVTTDDSFSKIIADARDELADRLTVAREHPVAQRVSDLLDELASKLKEPPR